MCACVKYTWLGLATASVCVCVCEGTGGCGGVPERLAETEKEKRGRGSESKNTFFLFFSTSSPDYYSQKPLGPKGDINIKKSSLIRDFCCCFNYLRPHCKDEFYKNKKKCGGSHWFEKVFAEFDSTVTLF